MLRPSSSAPNASAASSRRRPLPLPPHARKTTTTSPDAAIATAAAAANAANAANNDAPLTELCARRSATVYSSPHLLRAAKLARQQIDGLFAEPRTLDTRRLLDPFYVQGQYNLLRTQPGALLGTEAASAVADALVAFGEEHLGLNAITPPWISFYLDGMSQEMHVDAFQGPLAFVLPLSYWGDEEDQDEEGGDDGPALVRRPRVFVGGETAILRHGVLRYWDGAAEAQEEEQPMQQQQQQQQQKPKQRRRSKTTMTTTTQPPPTTRSTAIDLSGGSFQSNRGQELDHLFARIPPRFGRLLVFDGRLPHGVRPVHCPTADPRDARIALHAWFAPPEGPFFSGALADGAEHKKAKKALDAALRPLMQELAEECPPASGLLTARLRISGATGLVEEPVEWLSDTLVVSPGVCVDGGIGEREARALIQHVVRERLRGVAFPVAGAPSSATVPLLFE